MVSDTCNVKLFYRLNLNCPLRNADILCGWRKKIEINIEHQQFTI